ncbi:PaaI family thioesterase [Qipengyuania sp. MTN3-11]|uniref:PaaI family thioesterase n=1 Tax=Qipengyuania sp. MTN3-11 TaxID=3056557 RepID=UPI0036F3C37F
MTKATSTFDLAQAAPFLLARAHNGWLGLTYHAHGEDWVELELPWRADLLGDDGREVLASGPIISLMDMASGLSIWTATGAFRAIATLDLRVDYTRPAKEQASVFGRAQCYRTTRSAFFVRGVAHDGDPEDPVAHMQAVFMGIDAGTVSLPISEQADG